MIVYPLTALPQKACFEGCLTSILCLNDLNGITQELENKGLIAQSMADDSLDFAKLLIKSSGDNDSEHASLSATAIYKDQTFNYPKDE